MRVTFHKAPVFISLSIGLLFYGFLSTLISVILVHLKVIFELSYSISALIHLTFFSTYVIASFPASRMVKTWGYKLSLIVGYFTTGLGCMLFYFGITSISYSLLIGSIFVMAVGSTILLVVCNLYIVLLGDLDHAAARLSIVHSFYAIGCFIAPLYGSEWIKTWWGISTEMDMETYIKVLAHYIQTPFIVMSNLMYLLTVMIVFLNLPEFNTSILIPWNKFNNARKRLHVMHFKQLRLGAFAVFAYIGTEVAISEWLVTYFTEYTHWYWAGYVVGLVVGSILLMRFSPRKMLVTFAISASVVLIFTMFLSGYYILWIVISLGFFNSILFPTIWSLAIKGIGRFAEQGAAVMVMAHVGGGVIPFNVVNFAEAAGYQVAFIIPLLCYGFIIFYGVNGSYFEANIDAKKSTMHAIMPSK